MMAQMVKARIVIERIMVEHSASVKRLGQI